MRKLIVLAALAGIISLPVMASAAPQNCAGQVTAGHATLSPNLTGTPYTGVGSYCFGSVASDACGSLQNCGTFAPGSSCSGNVHMGTVPPGSSKIGGFSYQGVCVGATCDGGGMTTAGPGLELYQLVFTPATVTNAVTNCPGKGISTADFTGASEGAHN